MGMIRPRKLVIRHQVLHRLKVAAPEHAFRQLNTAFYLIGHIMNKMQGIGTHWPAHKYRQFGILYIGDNVAKPVFTFVVQHKTHGALVTAFGKDNNRPFKVRVEHKRL